MRITVFQIKLLHTLIFWILCGSIAYALFCGLTNRIGPWTWVAVVLVFVESIVLIASGFRCPLTVWAERRGALRGSVADIFLPKWMADRLFPICGVLYALAIGLLFFRLLS